MDKYSFLFSLLLLLLLLLLLGSWVTRASMIKFMEKEISENVTGKIYLLINYLFDNLMYLLLLIVDCVMLCYEFTRKSIVL